MPEVIFNGPEGRLEGKLNLSRQTNAPIVVILHPHPVHGGTMNNKVVYTLYKVFAGRGFSCLRFNFRGVGRSQGKFNNGEGELADAATALDWMQANCPDTSRCWVAGYSFGAWIGLQLLMRRPEIAAFVSVATPASMYDFGFLNPCPSSGLFVSGSKDEIVPNDSIQGLVERLRRQQDIKIKHTEVEGADHFFANNLDGLAGEIGNYLSAAEGIR